MSLAGNSTPPTLSTQEQAVLDWVHASFADDGAWPTFAALDSAMDRQGIDAYATLQALDERLTRSRRFVTEDDRVELNLEGIALAHGGDATITLFLRVLGYCVDLERRHTHEGKTGPCTVHSDELASLMIPKEVRLSFELLKLDHSINGGWGCDTEAVLGSSR